MLLLGSSIGYVTRTHGLLFFFVLVRMILLNFVRFVHFELVGLDGKLDQQIWFEF